jgi:hypothetical protein
MIKIFLTVPHQESFLGLHELFFQASVTRRPHPAN